MHPGAMRFHKFSLADLRPWMCILNSLSRLYIL